MYKGTMNLLTVLFALLLVNGAFAQTSQYNQMTWGIQNTGSSPYPFGANINGTWYNLGTVSSTGNWVIAGGSGGSPGGVNGQLQYNNSGLFAGLPYGTAAQVLIGNATGAPTWGSVNLGSMVTGNLPIANGGTGLTSFSRSGNTTVFGTTNGSLTNGHCVSIDSSGNLVDAGGACGSGSGGGTVVGSNFNTSITSYGSVATQAVVNSTSSLTANLVVPANVTLVVQKGGCITQSASYTLQINGAIVAPPGQQIFCGFSGSQITMGSSTGPVLSATSTVYPEWWGADVTGVNDSGVAIQAATNSIVNGGTVQFSAGNYNSSTCNWTLSIKGSAWVGITAGGSSATNINCSSASATILTVSSSVSPSYLNITGGFVFTRTAATPAVNSKGIVFQNISTGDFKNITVANSQYNYVLQTFSAYCKECDSIYTLSTSPGSSSANKIYLFWIDTAYPANSTYLKDTFAFEYPAPGVSGRTASTVYGYYINNSTTSAGQTANDIFLDNASSANVDIGAYYNGNVGNAYDVHFINNVHDTYSTAGIIVDSVPGTPGGAVTIDDGWFAPAYTGSTTYGIEVLSSRGVNITGGTQIFGGANYANNYGIYCYASNNVNVTGNRIMNSKYGYYANGCGTSVVSANNFWNTSGQSATAQMLLGISGGVSNQYRSAYTGNSFDGYATTAIDATYETYSSFSGNNCNTGNISTCETGTKSNNNQTVDAIVPADPSWTPVCTFSSGSGTSCTINYATVSKVGRTVTITLALIINYSSAPSLGTLSISLPYTAVGSNNAPNQVLPGRDYSSGNSLQGTISGGTNSMVPFAYNNGWITSASGAVVVFSGTYQANQ